MTTLVFGASGQVGSILADMKDVTAIDRVEADLSVAGACRRAIETRRPAAVINAAAYTAVDQAEEETDLAFRINAAAPTEMAHACTELGIPLIHLSTDYVFDGSGTRAWQPDDVPAPLSVYGKSKLAGEEGIKSATDVFAIIRTSWVFARHGDNFVNTMLRLGSERRELQVVSNEFGAPTPAQAIASACFQVACSLIAHPGLAGTYHFAGGQDISRSGFARKILSRVGIPCKIIDIASSDYPAMAIRPENSRLDCTSLLQTFGIERPDWEVALPSRFDYRHRA